MTMPRPGEFETAIRRDDTETLKRLCVQSATEGSQGLAALAVNINGMPMLAFAYQAKADRCFRYLFTSLAGDRQFTAMSAPLTAALDPLVRMLIVDGNVRRLKQLLDLDMSRSLPDIDGQATTRGASILKLVTVGDFKVTGPNIIKAPKREEQDKEEVFALQRLPRYHDVVDVVASYAAPSINRKLGGSVSQDHYFQTGFMEETFDLGVIAILAKHGADLDVLSRWDGAAEGVTPLDLALTIKNPSRRQAAIEALTDAGAGRFTGGTLEFLTGSLPGAIGCLVVAGTHRSSVRFAMVQQLLSITPQSERADVAAAIQAHEWPFEITCYALAVADAAVADGESKRLDAYLSVATPSEDFNPDVLAAACVSNAAFDAIRDVLLARLHGMFPADIDPATFALNLPTTIPDTTVATILEGFVRHGYDPAAHRTELGDGLVSVWNRALSLDHPRYAALRVLLDAGCDVNEIDHQGAHILSRFAGSVKTLAYYDDPLKVPETLITRFGADGRLGTPDFASAVESVLSELRDEDKTPRLLTVARELRRQNAAGAVSRRTRCPARSL